ncbi:hypothetical protein [Clostridium sp. UBA1353]|uniref:hypothetical protein n=1 Tax=Clostridium sp. UBA1353 TaxID=1946347 RepID=UPI0032170EA0
MENDTNKIEELKAKIYTYRENIYGNEYNSEYIEELMKMVREDGIRDKIISL